LENRSSTNKKRTHLIGVIIAVLAAITAPLYIASPYYLHLMIMACINIMLGLGFSLMYSTGLATIGAAGIWAAGAYASALLVMKLGISFWLALPLAGVAGALVAACTGLIIVRTPGVAFIVQTMVLNMLIVQIFGEIEFFGSWAGLLDIPAPSIGSFVFVRKTSFYYLDIALLFVCMLSFHALYTSRIGRAWQAIRLNPHLAEALGIDLFRYRLLAFVIASASMAVAGSFYAHYFRSIEPGMFSVFKSIYVQIFSILGGLNFYLLGPVIGAAIMTFVPEWLRIGKEIEPILTGAVLIALVIFMPGGILSIPERLSGLRRQPDRKKRPAAERTGS
jgi:branched-chain amino acid transport system permease protein